MHYKSNLDMIGILANEVISDGPVRTYPITINKNNDLLFTIIPLSEYTSNIDDHITSLQCYSNELSSYGFKDLISESEETRKNEIGDFLSDSLIVFKAEKRETGLTDYYYVAKDIRLVEIPDEFDRNNFYKPIPVFKVGDQGEKFHENSIERFEEKLKTHQFVGKANNFSIDEYDYPTNIIWESESQRYLYSEIISHDNEITGVKYKLSGDNFRKTLIPNDWEKFVSTNGGEEDILFIPVEKLDDINVCLAAEEIRNNIDSSSLEIDDEQQFMQDFIKMTQSEKYNLFYDTNDLYNFHTAMKTSNLVVLAGLSGTGKSKLIKAYGDALRIKDEQIKFVPVRPFWQDDSDLLGYPDTINSIYRAGDSGVVDLLIDAKKNINKIYIVCFDEMNIAKVEHYFSQFLSLLEMDYEQRILNLYNQDLENRFYNSEKYPPNIMIPKNVLFVGTVNLDESTYQFSDKVLDRSNVIKLNLLPFSKMLESKVENKSKKNIAIDPIDFEKYQGFFSENEGLCHRELDFFWDLHKLINDNNNAVGIGWRIIKQMDEYLKNIPSSSPLNKKEAIDLQVVQRVLTKIRGSEEELKELLGNGENTGTLVNLLDENHDISDFKNTRERVIQKNKELLLHGYTV